jgi:hypothetical protein
MGSIMGTASLTLCTVLPIVLNHQTLPPQPHSYVPLKINADNLLEFFAAGSTPENLGSPTDGLKNYLDAHPEIDQLEFKDITGFVNNCFAELMAPTPPYPYLSTGGQIKSILFDSINPIVATGQLSFLGCYSIENITISAGTSIAIGDNTFNQCAFLKNFINYGIVTEIQNGAFTDC